MGDSIEPEMFMGNYYQSVRDWMTARCTDVSRPVVFSSPLFAFPLEGATGAFVDDLWRFMLVGTGTWS